MHLERHDGVKRFVCLLCDAKFYREYDLQVHISTVHEGKKRVKKSWTKEEIHSIINLRIYTCKFSYPSLRKRNPLTPPSSNRGYLNNFFKKAMQKPFNSIQIQFQFQIQIQFNSKLILIPNSS